MIRTCTALTLILLGLLWLAAGCSKSHPQQPSSTDGSSTPTPEPTASGLIFSVDEARSAAAFFVAGQPGSGVRSDNIRSVTYVETTLGPAENIIQPHPHRDSLLPSNTRTWLFVADGDYATIDPLHPNQPLRPAKIWILVPRGGAPLQGFVTMPIDLASVAPPRTIDPGQMPEIDAVRVDHHVYPAFTVYIHDECDAGEAVKRYLLGRAHQNAANILSLTSVKTTRAKAAELIPNTEANPSMPAWLFVADGYFWDVGASPSDVPVRRKLMAYVTADQSDAAGPVGSAADNTIDLSAYRAAVTVPMPFPAMDAACAPTQATQPSPPTPLPDIPVTNDGEAITAATPYLVGWPVSQLKVSNVSFVGYLMSTISKGEPLVVSPGDPPRTPTLRTMPLWIFVAYGDFQDVSGRADEGLHHALIVNVSADHEVDRFLGDELLNFSGMGETTVVPVGQVPEIDAVRAP